jgi:FPC/CPF motif-containing protein YcgG
MQIAITHNGTVTAVGDYRQLFPQTSFPDSGPNQSFLAENDCLPVTLHKPFDSATHKLAGCAAYIQNGQVYTVQVEALNADDLAQRQANKAAEIRSRRDALLKDSDWTQIADFPKTNQNDWKQFRKALRDLPQQAGFPDNIIWPIAPGAT